MNLDVKFMEQSQTFDATFSEGNNDFKTDMGQLNVVGIPGATFTPHVSNDGVISWTNDFDLENPAPVSIKGPQGAKGDKGDTGAAGPQGIKGDTGPQGPQGLQGPQGAKGNTGATGQQGPQGPQGPQGYKGDKGDKGADGVSPTVSVSVIDGGHHVSITDKNGTKSFDVMDGKDGEGGGGSVEGLGELAYKDTVGFDDLDTDLNERINGAPSLDEWVAMMTDMDTRKVDTYFEQEFTETEKAMARKNIGAISASDVDWDTMQNKPFGEMPTGGDTLTWDGNTDGLLSVEGNWYKVSDVVLTEEELLNGMVGGEHARLTVYDSDNNILFRASSSDELEDMFGELGFGVVADFVICAPTDNYEVPAFGVTFPEKGIYFLDVVRCLYVANCTSFPVSKPIDNKYLPNAAKAIMVWLNEDGTYDTPPEEIAKTFSSGGRVCFVKQDWYDEYTVYEATDGTAYPDGIGNLYCTRFSAISSKLEILIVDNGGWTLEEVDIMPSEDAIVDKVIAALPTENWVFTMEDGTEITKKVVIA